MAKNTIFHDCVVVDIIPAQTPGWKLIKLEQETTTQYTGDGDSTGFELQNEVAPNPLEFKGVRTNTQRVKDEVAEKFAIGQIIEGRVIQRTAHSTPQWDGHSAAQDGKFYTSQLVKESAYTGDKVDMTPAATPAVSHEQNIAQRTGIPAGMNS